MAEVVFRVFRYKEGDRQPHYDQFTIACDERTTVLAALQQVRQSLDSSLMLRYSCGHASCGTCGVRINGRERLSCLTRVSSLGASVVTVEPLRGLSLVSDLVVDSREFMKRLSVPDTPQLRQCADGSQRFEDCIECSLCVSACPTAVSDAEYAGPAALAAAWRSVQESRPTGPHALAWADSEQGCWRCHLAHECSEVCPAGVDPAGAILRLRRLVLTWRVSAEPVARPRSETASTSLSSAAAAVAVWTAIADGRARSPAAVARAWFDFRHRSAGAAAFALNRVTGVGLLAYLYLHLGVLTLLLQGESVWNSLIGLARSPWFLGLDVILFAGVLFHALNGVRLSWLAGQTPASALPATGPGRLSTASLTWLVQVVTGCLLAALLGLHLIAQHFVASGGLRDFHDVLSYVANPLVVVLELAFLLLVVVHGLLGVRSIALDLGPSSRARTWLGRATIAIGLGTLSYGIWLGLAIQRLAT